MNEKQIITNCTYALRQGIKYAKQVRGSYQNRIKNETDEHISILLFKLEKNVINDIIEMESSLKDLLTL